jgi:phasin
MTDTETMTKQTEAAMDSVKQAFAPIGDAMKNLQTIDVPEATRDFVRRAAGTAKDKAADLHAGAEKMTVAVETAVTGSVSEAAKITRNIQTALYADAAAFFAGIDKLASAKSFGEAVQIQSELARSHGEVLVSRAKASTEYFGKLVADGAKTAQDNISKVASYSKTA